jgi:LCP family protein required for cell wall assembly
MNALDSAIVSAPQAGAADPTEPADAPRADLIPDSETDLDSDAHPTTIPGSGATPNWDTTPDWDTTPETDPGQSPAADAQPATSGSEADEADEAARPGAPDVQPAETGDLIKLLPSDEDLIEQGLATRQAELLSGSGPKRALVEPRQSFRERRAKTKREKRTHSQQTTSTTEPADVPSEPAEPTVTVADATASSPWPASTAVLAETAAIGPATASATDLAGHLIAPAGSATPVDSAASVAPPTATESISSTGSTRLGDAIAPARPAASAPADALAEPITATGEDRTAPAPESGARSASSPTEPTGQRAGRQTKPKPNRLARASSATPSRAAPEDASETKPSRRSSRPPRPSSRPDPAGGPPDNFALALLGRLVPALGLRRAGFNKLAWLAWSVLPILAAGAAWTWFSSSARLYLFFSVGSLRLVLVLLIGLALAWSVALWLMQRGARSSGGRSGAGRPVLSVVVAVLVCGGLGWGARLTYLQVDALDTVFASAGRPGLATSPLTPADILSAERVNIMLLGLDSGLGNVNPTGPKTDTVMVASVEPSTGQTVLISLSRNTARMPFPVGSTLESHFQKGWFDGSNPSNPDYLLGAMYEGLPDNVDRNQLGQTDNLGADALKLSVGAALGLRIDYYVLIDLAVMADLIDALGGVTLDVNRPITIPGGRIEPGPQQHLDGATAVAFTRSIGAGDDYARMARSRCVVQAVLSHTSPTDLTRHFIDIAQAARSGVRSDIPVSALPQLVELADRVQRSDVISLQFTNNQNGFVASRPNFQRVAEQVQSAIELARDPAPAEPDQPDDSGSIRRTADPRPLPEFCAFNPDSDW